MGIFERFLSLWVGLAIAAGVGLGLLVPSVFTLVAGLEITSMAGCRSAEKGGCAGQGARMPEMMVARAGDDAEG